MWVDYEGDRIVINTAEGRAKPRNMRDDPRVALSATDPDNPYEAVIIRGRVSEMTHEGADEHIHRLSRKYRGRDYDNFNPDETEDFFRRLERTLAPGDTCTPVIVPDQEGAATSAASLHTSDRFTPCRSSTNPSSTDTTTGTGGGNSSASRSSERRRSQPSRKAGATRSITVTARRTIPRRSIAAHPTGRSRENLSLTSWEEKHQLCRPELGSKSRPIARRRQQTVLTIGVGPLFFVFIGSSMVRLGIGFALGKLLPC